MALIRKTLNGENQFSDEAFVKEGFSFSLRSPSGFSGTVTLQRRFSPNDPWGDVNTYTFDFEGVDVQPQQARFRFGIKTGDYVSGSIVGIIVT